MTNQIFGRRLDGDVNAMIEGPEIKRGCPAVIQDDHRVMFMGGGGDGGNILDLEG